MWPRNHSYITKGQYDTIQIINLKTSTRLSLNITSNDYSQTGKFIIKQENVKTAYSLYKSCYATHKDKLYFYGGSLNSRQVSELDCDRFKVHDRKLNFDLDDGICASNNNYIFLCFPVENKRLCYKSKSPLPNQWWEWFTYVELSYATHDSITLSSGKISDPSRMLGTLKTNSFNREDKYILHMYFFLEKYFFRGFVCCRWP